jgi:hypothetical protein
MILNYAKCFWGSQAFCLAEMILQFELVASWRLLVFGLDSLWPLVETRNSSKPRATVITADRTPPPRKLVNMLSSLAVITVVLGR